MTLKNRLQNLTEAEAESIAIDAGILTPGGRELTAPYRDDDSGDLHDYRTGEYIRPATAEEISRSEQSDHTGAIVVDGRTVYVAR